MFHVAASWVRMTACGVMCRFAHRRRREQRIRIRCDIIEDSVIITAFFDRNPGARFGKNSSAVQALVVESLAVREVDLGARALLRSSQRTSERVKLFLETRSMCCNVR
eukprot:4751523-Pyramimonas_sp.AAC.1